MQMSGNTMRRGIAGVLAAGVLGGLAATTIALPTASADADCTVSGLSNAIGAVGAQTGQWFASHPDANKAVTDAGGSGQSLRAAIRNYFIGHPSEWAELQRIAQPLRNLNSSCGSNVAPPTSHAFTTQWRRSPSVRRADEPPARRHRCSLSGTWCSCTDGAVVVLASGARSAPAESDGSGRRWA